MFKSVSDLLKNIVSWYTMFKSGRIRGRGGGNKILFVGILVIVVLVIAYVSLVGIKEGMTLEDKNIILTDSEYLITLDKNGDTIVIQNGKFICYLKNKKSENIKFPVISSINELNFNKSNLSLNIITKSNKYIVNLKSIKNEICKIETDKTVFV